MKKIYNSRETKIVQLRTHHMIAASPMDLNQKYGNSTVYSRRNNDWDWGDDDE